jgi:BolA protein
MPVRDQIAEKLTAAFAPQSLRVEDESSRHAGHAGHRPGGETHFRVTIVAEAFRGKSRIERHRLVNTALAAELAGGVHALAIHASTPNEGSASVA